MVVANTMVVAFVLAVFAGLVTNSFLVFVIPIALAMLFVRPDRPFSDSLLKLALMAMSISALSPL